MEMSNHPLSDAELDRLDRFLLDRIDEDAVTDKLDEGVIDVSTLDGLLTAVVSGPVMVPPSIWLPALWGDFEPEWNDKAEFEDIFHLLIRHMNSIANTLMQQPEDFEPLYFCREVEGETYLIVDEWCEGYMIGMSLADTVWLDGGEEINKLLAPILAFTSATEWKGHDRPEEDVRQLQLLVAPTARAVHGFWLARREPMQSPELTVHRSEPKPGRNDPCPCGSGKKYKRCCLQ